MLEKFMKARCFAVKQYHAIWWWIFRVNVIDGQLPFCESPLCFIDVLRCVSLTASFRWRRCVREAPATTYHSHVSTRHITSTFRLLNINLRICPNSHVVVGTSNKICEVLNTGVLCDRVSLYVPCIERNFSTKSRFSWKADWILSTLIEECANEKNQSRLFWLKSKTEKVFPLTILMITISFCNIKTRCIKFMEAFLNVLRWHFLQKHNRLFVGIALLIACVLRQL